MYATQTIRNRFGLLGSQANQSVVFVLVYLMEVIKLQRGFLKL